MVNLETVKGKSRFCENWALLFTELAQIAKKKKKITACMLHFGSRRRKRKNRNGR
jgi:hypothetical protein